MRGDRNAAQTLYKCKGEGKAMQRIKLDINENQISYFILMVSIILFPWLLLLLLFFVLRRK